MNKRTDYILLGVLWLLATTLAATFWFNTMFGFNIFSSQHWQYLAYMQASRQAVRPMFYISLVLAVLIPVAGLYMMMRPRLRRIRLPKIRTTGARREKTQKSAAAPAPAVQPTTQTTPAADTAQKNSAAPTNLTRPARPIGAFRAPPWPSATHAATTPRAPARNPEQDFEKIRQIFEDAGYVSKGNPRIGGIRMAALAIGTGEILWIGAIGVETEKMGKSVEQLRQIFSDTLDDIEINVHPFIINAPDAAANKSDDIMQFESIDGLREYISAHPNTPPTPETQGDFDAYSAYITTVADYVGKI